MSETLTLERLARAIHEDEKAAAAMVNMKINDIDSMNEAPDWDGTSERFKNMRREQARLMLERWLR